MIASHYDVHCERAVCTPNTRCSAVGRDHLCTDFMSACRGPDDIVSTGGRREICPHSFHKKSIYYSCESIHEWNLPLREAIGYTENPFALTVCMSTSKIEWIMSSKNAPRARHSFYFRKLISHFDCAMPAYITNGPYLQFSFTMCKQRGSIN